MKNFWISWYGNGSFEGDFPWWVSGEAYLADGEPVDVICAAIKAESEDDAWRKIKNIYNDDDGTFRQRFCEERPDDWAPYADRFPKAEWMSW